MTAINNKLTKIILFITLLFNSCLEESVISDLNMEFDNTALLVREIELRGDYINSSDFPALIEASQVVTDLSNYIILDVRSPNDFSSGHIEGAVNIVHTELFNYVLNIDSIDKNILMVSATGQSAAYYTSLFRLYGLKNVYSLNFGMASWHKDFSGILTDKFRDISSGEKFHNIDNPKPAFTHLPVVIKSQNTLTEDFIKERISILFNEGFDESSNSASTININGELDQLADLINDNNMIICYGTEELFFLPKRSELSNPGHPKGAVLYQILNPFFEMRSDKYLQTLATDKTLYLYSFSGQLSAMGVAYLRLLGYDAKSVLYGAHNMFYSRLLSNAVLIPFAFRLNLVRDFPYVK